ncbi:MAG: hypothetical protein ACKOCT_16170 [Alphaproteobacteria bacterium]
MVVETLTTVAVGLLALAAFTTLHVGQMYAMRDQVRQVDLQSSARDIADLFSREVRRAGSGTNPSCTGTASTGLLLAKSNEVRIRADLDANGALTGAQEDVTWKLDSAGSAVTRTQNNSSTTETLWSGPSLGNSRIVYFDASGNQLSPGGSGLSAAQLLQVVRIRIELDLKGSSTQKTNTNLQVAAAAADVELRNRRFLTPANCPYL